MISKISSGLLEQWIETTFQDRLNPNWLGLCVMTGMGDVRPGTESKKNKEASNEQSGTQPGKLRTWRCRKKVKIHHRRNATQAMSRPAF
jgi:hypothetical protein